MLSGQVRFDMFILFFDNRYFRWAPPLIESIMIHEPEERIGIYGVKLTKGQVRKLHSYSCVDYIPSALQRTHYVFWKRDDVQAARIIQRIASFLLESFRRFPGEKLYMVLDVDSLLVNPLTELKQKMVDYDMGVSLGRTKARPGFVRQARTGFVPVNPTKASKTLVKDWHRLLMRGPCHWSKGQMTLFQLYEDRRNKMRFLRFGISYRDPASKNESYIWSAYKTTYGSKAERYMLYQKKLEEMKSV